CGEDAAAERILAEHASHLRRVFPAGPVVERDLAQALDALALRRPLSIPLRLLRARIRARQGGAEEALAEVAELRADDPLVDLDLGELSFATGRLADALGPLTRAAGDGRLGVLAQIWATIVLVEAHRMQGAVARARDVLLERASLFEQAGDLGEALRT